MSVELRAYARKLRAAGYEEAANHFEEEAINFEKDGKIPFTLKRTEVSGNQNKDSKIPRKEIEELGNKLRIGFGGTADDGVLISDLKHGIENMNSGLQSRILKQQEKYPEWFDLLQKSEFDNLSRQKLTAVFNAVLREGTMKTVGEIRRRTVEDLSRLDYMGESRSLLIS